VYESKGEKALTRFMEVKKRDKRMERIKKMQGENTSKKKRGVGGKKGLGVAPQVKTKNLIPLRGWEK